MPTERASAEWPATAKAVSGAEHLKDPRIPFSSVFIQKQFQCFQKAAKGPVLKTKPRALAIPPCPLMSEGSEGSATRLGLDA